jgi:hypothetical protein
MHHTYNIGNKGRKQNSRYKEEIHFVYKVRLVGLRLFALVMNKGLTHTVRVTLIYRLPVGI